MGEVDATQSATRSDGSLRSLASILMDRFNFMKQAGLTFGGKRDLYEIFGYDRIITNKQYRDEYARGGIAKRIVEAFPKATWRGGVDLFEDEDPETNTAFEDAWHELQARLKIWTVLQRADILAGLSTYSVILIGVAGEEGLDQELPEGSPEKLLYLTAFSGGGGPGPNNSGTAQSASNYVDAAIQDYETDAKSPRFGLPKTYKLRRLDIASPELQKPIHWSRIIHVAEGCLDNEVFGQPTLENVWNLLQDLEKVTGGGAEAFFQRANQGMNINLDKDVKDLGVAAAAKLKDEIEEYQHNITRVLKTRGMEVKMLGSDTANFSGPVDSILKQISGSKAIPLRILTGSEMGQLASGQDADNWNTQVTDRRTGHAGPNIVRPLVDRLIAYGYLPTPKQYEVEWPVIQNLTLAERAELAHKMASVNATYGASVFTDSEIRELCFDLDEQEDVITDAFRAELAVKMATVNKTQGVVVFTPKEIRKTAYGWAPLSPAEEVPVGAPERISVNTPPTEPGQAPAAKPAKLVPKAAEAFEETVRLLEQAIEDGDVATIDEVLGLDPERLRA